jgi:SAM-dependent methyltransferase
MRKRFDKAYYDRFYRNATTRAVTPASARRQAQFIAAYLRHLDVGVRHVLEIGCGTGLLLRALARQLPRASVQGVEFSDYLCTTYGWQPGSVVDFRPERPADLVICNDVLGYLDDGDCDAALNNLAAVTGRALYLGVLTREDLPLCDSSRTDPLQRTRRADWYRRRLEPHFLNVGGSLYLRKPVQVAVWQLERA